MTRSKPLAAFVLSSLTALACAHQTPEPQTPAAPPPPATVVVAEPAPPPPPPEPMPAAEPVQEPPPAPALNDAQIAKVLEAVDTGEIEQAKVAQKKSKSPLVKKFAAHMIQAHSKTKAKGAAWVKKAKLTPEESPVSQDLGSKGAAQLEALNANDALTFDNAYVQAQVTQHEEVLTLIDGQLSPAAQSDDLKKMLQEVRTMVETHITMAKTLQTQVSPAQ